MKKYTLTTIPLFLAAAAPLCADNAIAATTTPQQKQQMEMNAITPSAEPAVPNCCSPFITADFIWWKAQEEGLVYATNGESTALGAPTQGSLYQPSFHFKPGFKVGFGLKFRHDGWDLYAQYTWLNSTSNSNTAPNFTESSQLSTYMTLDRYYVETANANWKLKFNTLDLELGRNFWISKWLTLRPKVGFKFAGVFQNMYVTYGDTLIGTTHYGNTNVHLKNNELGVGLRAGLDSKFYMNKYFSVYGNLAVSALWNRFHTLRTDTTYNTANTVVERGFNVKKTLFDVTEVLELALGLSFEYPFHDDDYMWFLQAGWEEQVWFNQNKFPLLTNADENNLSFEGLTIATGFYF